MEQWATSTLTNDVHRWVGNDDLEEFTIEKIKVEEMGKQYWGAVL